ncbi:NAD(P)/FAD-dependent oxidoreductase [Nocardia sp. NPDC050713]|uniref:flavin-containing monooxygenase n=1 Tax=Nocardia sp. NPDC050713 TaxID=3154511 RepID=UPI003405F8E0
MSDSLKMSAVDPGGNIVATPIKTADERTFDAVVIGAGFSGVRMLLELRKLGLSGRVLDAGSDVGGTWHWNRYPGARTDSESWVYCLSFSKELMGDWDWKERYPQWEEVNAYLRHVADRFDLRRDIQFDTRVVSARFDDETNSWTVTTSAGEQFTCTYLITGLGILSLPVVPEIAGRDRFEGDILLTADWPEAGVDLRGKRVAVIGTGATGIQLVPVVAEQCDRVTVFQRTPNFAVPAQNYPLDDAKRAEIRRNYDSIWSKARDHVFGFPLDPAGRVYDDVTDEERERIFEENWQRGGWEFLFETFDDIVLDQRSNDAAAEFIRNKIRSIVNDPDTAELLCPKGYPYVGKRPPLEHGYYEAFNRENVRLVDVSQNRLTEITEKGLRLADGQEFDADVVVFATGFDAVTGPFERIDIRNGEGLPLVDAWSEGANTYLGVGTPGFPNLLMVSGPQTLYANFPMVSEMNVEWFGELLRGMRERGLNRVEVTKEASDAWSAHLDDVFRATLLTDGAKVGSWYLGANIPGKPRKILFYFGGGAAYRQAWEASRDNNFEGFVLTTVATETPAAAAL